MDFKYQAHMPEQCPPAIAVADNISPVYRFIEDELVQPIDFLNHVERKKPYPPAKACEALALSFFTTSQAAESAGKKIKSLRNKKFISGQITTDCGIHYTRREHLNLWLYKDVDMKKVFLGEEGTGGDK